VKINWKEVFKFLSGAAFAGSLANFYLYSSHITLTIFGFTIKPGLIGLRALLQFILFIVFFYFGYLYKKENRSVKLK